MSLSPPHLPSDLERTKWNVPPELERLVLDSFEELKERLPADEEYGEVYLRSKNRGHRERFDRYSRNEKGYKGGPDVAYGCPKCKKIIVGPPRIEDENSIGISPLAGREGYDFYCKNCYNHLGEHTLCVS